jgi:WD40 repeat protein
MRELAAGLPAAGVVRVIGPEGTGAGFLVSAGGLIVTCAHVLAGGKPGTAVSVEPHVGRVLLPAAVELLQDPPDLGVLRLTVPVPPGVTVLPLGRSPTALRPGLRTFGYPRMRAEDGLPGQLDFFGVTAADGYDQLVLRSEEATLGFSGAPVWDPELGAVVGMVRSIARGDPGQRLGSTAIGVPAEVIRELCPELRLPSGCPYRGLEPFTEEHVDYYYGREDATSRLLANLAESHFIAVVAVSGGGKSSLLQAGLAKGLRDRRVLGLAQRVRCYLRISGEPHAELLDSLARHGMVLPLELAAAPAETLAAAIHGAAPPAGLIVVADQFERLYTDCRAAERKRFLALIRHLATDTVKVAIGLRADFYHLALADLGDRLAAAQVALAPMTGQALGQAIAAPAGKLLRSFQPGLTQQIIADVRDGPGDLPLLQFALTELWERDAADGLLTEQTYRSLGAELPDGTQLPGAQGALIRRAEQLWQELGPADQPRLQRILLGLISAQPAETSPESPADGTRNLSRPARLAQWNGDDQRLIQRLIDARLLTARSAPIARQPTVEVSHEALLRAWPRLRGWLAERGQYVQWRVQDLAPNLERWLDSHEDPEFLLPRPLLEPALRWLNDYPSELEGPPRDYIKASKRRRTRRRGLLSAVVAVLVAASLSAAGIFYSLQQTAVSQSRLAQSEELAAEAVGLFPTNDPLAMLFSVQAYESAPTVQAGNALAEAAQQPLDLILQGNSTADFTSVAFSPDGTVLAAGSQDGTISLWNAATGRKTAVLTTDFFIRSLAFSPDGKTLAAGGDSGDVILWNTATRKQVSTLAMSSPVGTLAFSPDGKTLAAGDDDGTVVLWDAATGRQGGSVNVGSAQLDSVAFSPDGKTIAAANGGDVDIWDTATGKRAATLVVKTGAGSVAFSPDGKTIAAGSFSGGDVTLWDTASGRQTAVLAVGSNVDHVAFSPGGKTLAAATGGSVKLWDVVTGQRAATLAPGSAVGNVAFSPEDQRIAVVDGDSVQIWDTESRWTGNLAEGSSVESVAFSPGEQVLAVGDLSGHVGLWDTATGKRTAALADASSVQQVAFSPGGTMLATGDVRSQVSLWDVATGKRAALMTEGSGPVNTVAFSPDGKTLATGGDTGTDGTGTGGVSLWDTATGKRIAVLISSANVFSVAFSANGKSLAVGSVNGFGVLDIATRQWTFATATGSNVVSVAFSPDDKTLAAGTGSGSVTLWSTATWRQVSTLPIGASVDGVAFSPNGGTLAVGDASGNLSLWDTSTRRRTSSVAEGSPVGSLAFNPNGQVLAIAHGDDAELLSQSPSSSPGGAAESLVCGEVRENLTQAEWAAAYAPGQPYQKTCPEYSYGS